MIETIASAINIAKGVREYQFPRGYFEAMDKKGRGTSQSREIRKQQDIAFHNGDTWWERYTERLRNMARPFRPWPTQLQNEAWWFYCGGLDCDKRNLLCNVSFAEYIIDRLPGNLVYRDKDGKKVEWLDD